MKTPLSKSTAGFAALEALLVVVVVAAIVGLGVYVMHQKDTADKNLNSTATSKTAAPAGTAAAIDQITQQDAQTEANVDKNNDNSVQQAAGSDNTAVNNVGGAYDENSL